MKKLSIETRRGWAQQALTAYNQAREGVKQLSSVEEDVIDLMTDLLHLAHHASGPGGFSLYELLEKVEDHFEAERGRP